MKSIRTIIVVMLLTILAVGAMAQDETTETPEFLRNMIQLMARSGWSDEDIAEFREACMEYQWEGLKEVDPSILMPAFRYSWNHAESEEGLTVQNRAQLAYALAQRVQEMTGLGMEDREAAVVASVATRDMLQTMTQAELQNPGVGDMLRDRLQAATQDHIGDYDRDRIRAGSQQGSTARHSEDPDAGFPPGSPMGTPPQDGSGPNGPKN